MKTLLTLLWANALFVVFGQEQTQGIYDEVKGVKSSDTLRVVEDSTLERYTKSIQELIELPSPFENNSLQKDSSDLKKKLIPGFSGTMSNGFEYGLLTSYIDIESTDPLKVFNSNGDFAVEALKLPLNVSYNYSTLRNPIGVNNYFRVSLDTERLKELKSEVKQDAVGDIQNCINDLERTKQDIQGKLGMGEVIMHKLKKDSSKQEQRMKDLKQQLESKVPNETSMGKNNDFETEIRKKDSIQALYRESENKLAKTKQVYDSVNKLYQKGLSIYQQYSEWQEQLDKKKELLNGDIKSTGAEAFKKSKVAQKGTFVSDIKTFDLGLTYPQTSGLSSNSVPIQGLNFEMQRGNWYSAVSAGVTMNNLMVSTDVVQNKLNNTQNLFNQFDFQNIQEKGMLAHIKTGYGTPEETHYFVGLRYLSNAIIGDTSIQNSIPSLGAELDIRWIPSFSKSSAIDFVYGKTSRNESLIDSTRNNVLSSLFSSDRTHTGLIRLEQLIAPLNTQIEISTRWIDPDADMRSFGVMQADNKRFEVRTQTALSKKVRFGLNYRRDQNNVSRYSDTTITLELIGALFNSQITKKTSLFANANYLTQRSISSILSTGQQNYMLGAGITHKYKLWKAEHAFTLSYNDYLITDSVSTGLFRSISVQNGTKLEHGSNTFSISYLKMDDPSLPFNTSIILGDEFSFEHKKFRTKLGVKTTYSLEYGRDIGGKLAISYRISEMMEWTVQGEKLVLGDFYNYYARDRFDRFPYALMTRINFTFN